MRRFWDGLFGRSKGQDKEGPDKGRDHELGKGQDRRPDNGPDSLHNLHKPNESHSPNARLPEPGAGLPEPSITAERNAHITHSEVKYLIVGLGNIGNEYADTRHNIGFKVLDALAGASNVVFSSDRYGERAEFRFKGRTFVLLKPSTYMNLSGKAVRYWLEKERIERTDMLVVLDDLALPLCTLRLRARGSDGGHNGLKSIDACLGSNDYPRLRVGIGNDFPQGYQADYVLGRWTAEEKTALESTLATTVEVIRSFGTQGLERTMNLYNGKSKG
jgi:PTH1 family peptidyl-tRNA hydrolase